MAIPPNNQRLPKAWVVNVSGSRTHFEIARGHGEEPDAFELDPGARVQIDGNYAMKFAVADGRDARPSTIELLTNGRVLPLDDPRARGFLTKDEDKALKAKAASGNHKPAPAQPVMRGETPDEYEKRMAAQAKAASRVD